MFNGFVRSVAVAAQIRFQCGILDAIYFLIGFKYQNGFATRHGQYIRIISVERSRMTFCR